MTTYNLNKSANNDIYGDILKNWINDNIENLHNITIKDKGIATITDLSDLFSGAIHYPINISSVDFSKFNTVNVTDMKRTFESCDNLSSISNFKTNNVTNMTNAFRHCTNLTSIPNFNMMSVENLSGTFAGCTNLTSVPNFNTSNVTGITAMFENCVNLVDVPEFNLSAIDEQFASNIGMMFADCNNLSNASIQNIINMCLNSNITNSMHKNLNIENYQSPLYHTKFDSSYYSNRLSELSSAGWTY